MHQVRKGSQEEQVGRLILAGVLVTFLPGVPLLGMLIYPFTILSTWYHEMGHGLTALAQGYQFDLLVVNADGSGYAQSRSPIDSTATSRALVAMGGPLGPSLIGSALILASSARKYWKPALIALAAALAISTLIWVRGLVGWIVLPALAATLILIAFRAPDWLKRFALQFLGVLGALSMFSDWDYLFSESGMVGGRMMLSDTGTMEAALWLPHWIWAIIIIAISGVMVGASLRYALNRQG